MTWHFHNGASRFESFLGGSQRHFMMRNKLLNISLLNFKTAPKRILSLGQSVKDRNGCYKRAGRVVLMMSPMQLGPLGESKCSCSAAL